LKKQIGLIDVKD